MGREDEEEPQRWESQPARKGPGYRTRIAANRHRWQCKYNTSEGIVVFCRGNEEDNIDSCDVPLVIAGKEIVVEQDPDPPYSSHNIKHLKLAPVGPSLGQGKVRVNLYEKDGIKLDRLRPVYWCAPFEKHFSSVWSRYTNPSEFNFDYDTEVRAALLTGLKQQCTFYPDLSYADFFRQLRKGAPGAEDEPVPPELEVSAPA